MDSDKPGKYKVATCFEELAVYQLARELCNSTYSITRQKSFSRDYSLVDQMRRAAVSIMSNIAEGYERGSKTELIQFLYIAKGSAGELRAQFQISLDLEYISKEEFERSYALARRVSGMLSNFIGHQQCTSYQGEKSARPQRQAANAQQQRIEALRKAQEANMKNKPL